jgi:hypothetical protein
VTGPAITPPTGQYLSQLPDTAQQRIIANVGKLRQAGATDDQVTRYLSQGEGLQSPKPALPGVAADDTRVTPPRSASPPAAAAPAGNLGDVAAYNATAGLAQDVDAAIQAATTPSSWHGHFWDNYHDAHQQYLQRVGTAQQNHPIASAAVGAVSGAAPILASLLAPELAPAVEGAQAALPTSFLGRTAVSAATGAAAQQGQRLINADTPSGVQHALLPSSPKDLPIAGATLGALLPAVASAVGSLVDLVTGQGPANRATNEMLSRLQQNQMTPSDLADRAAAAPDGAPMVAADFMGTPGLKAVRKATDTPSIAGTQLRQQLESRMTNQLDRTLANMKTNMGQDFANIPTTQEQMIADMKARAAPLYEQAKPMPLPQSIADQVGQLRQVFPEFDKAFAAGDALKAGDAAITQMTGTGTAPASASVPAAIDRLSPRIANDPNMLAILREKGVLPSSLDPEVSPPLTVGDVHYAKLGLDDLISGKAEGSGIAPTRARQLRVALNNVLQQTEAAVPVYGQARAQYRGDAEMNDALEFGKKALHLPVDEIQHTIQDYSPGERQAFQMSAMDQLKQAASNVSTRNDLMKRWLTTPNLEARLQLIAPSDEAAQNMLAHRNVERTMAATSQAPTAGSNTSTNMMDASGSPFSARTAAMMVTYPRFGMRYGLMDLVNQAVRQRGAATAEAIAPMLGTPAAEVGKLVDLLNRAGQTRQAASLAQLLTAGRLGQQAGAH